MSTYHEDMRAGIVTDDTISAIAKALSRAAEDGVQWQHLTTEERELINIHLSIMEGK